MDMLNKDHAMPIVSLRSIARVRGGAGVRVGCVGVCYILQQPHRESTRLVLCRHTCFRLAVVTAKGEKKMRKKFSEIKEGKKHRKYERKTGHTLQVEKEQFV